MAVPKKKTSLRRKRLRRSHSALSAEALSQCSHCGEYKRPHCVCKECGHYKGNLVIEQKQAVSDAALAGDTPAS